MGALWGGAGRPIAARPPLERTVDIDVAVVGGGVAGLSTALHLARAGASVVVLEADRIGSGATGSSAGVVAPQLVRTSPAKVLARFGDVHGAGLLQLVGDSGRYLFDLIADEDIDCDARRTGFLAPMSGRAAERRLADLVDEWRPFRTDLSVLGGQETAMATGCRGYGAALLDASGGAVDPLLLAYGLADSAERAGVVLHETSPVLSVEGGAGAWRVKTASGDVLARTVVLAANGGNAGLRPELRDSILPLPVCEVATEPLPQDMRDAILPGRQSLTDMEPDIFSIRYAAGDRLVTAFPAADRQTPDAIAEGVNRRLGQMLVVHRPLRLDHIWQGTAWVNANLLPRLVRVDDGMIAVQACNGRGLAINLLLGREVARALGRLPGSPLLPLEAPSRISGFRIARHLPKLMLSAALFGKRLRGVLGR